MTDQLELDRNPWPLAADLIVERGWTTGVEVADDGKVCMEGAVRLCAPVPGDGPIYREIVSHRGRGATFNDADGTTEDDVLRWLRVEAAPITDDELLDVFGPQWVEIVALVRRAATFSDEERDTYYAAVRAVWSSDDWSRAWQAVVVDEGPCDAARRALGAFGVYGGDADVCAALARRHEIGVKGGIRQEDYDVLCGPWAAMFGPVHPDDALVAA